MEIIICSVNYYLGFNHDAIMCVTLDMKLNKYMFLKHKEQANISYISCMCLSFITIYINVNNDLFDWLLLHSTNAPTCYHVIMVVASQWQCV